MTDSEYTNGPNFKKTPILPFFKLKFKQLKSNE